MRLGRFSVADCFYHDEARKRELFAVSVIFSHLIILAACHDPQTRRYDYVAMSLDDSFDDIDVTGANDPEVPEYAVVFHTKRQALGVAATEFKFHRVDAGLPREASLPAHNPALWPHS